MLTLLVAGCGSNPPAGGADAGQVDGGVCTVECVVGWWTVATGRCDAFCSLSPSPPQCASGDCEQLDAYILRTDGSYDLHLMIHSPMERTFTVFTKQTRAWSLVSECSLSLDPTNDPVGGSFACTASSLEFEARPWNRPDELLADALADASAAELPCSHSY